MSNLTQSNTWKTLEEHYGEISESHMRDMFAEDPQRFEKFSLKLNDILFDYSKNIIDSKTMEQLYQLANDCDMGRWIQRMFDGEPINQTEHRAVLHTALRNKSGEAVMVDGEDVMPAVLAVQQRVKKLAEAIRTRSWRGYYNQPITDVVNIGIGGSNLGPLMVTEALRPYSLHDLNIHYVSNIDENHINDTLEKLNPGTTFFIIASKSFTTQDTMVNAETARQWHINAAGDDRNIDKHFCAVSSNVKAAVEFGIDENNVFQMWDWVGGRYSLWSAISLPIVIAIGQENFDELLRGAYEADVHFKNAPLNKNIPVTMAMLGIWYNNFFGAQATAVLPYDQHLHKFPAYMQQADMESNGKSVDRQGQVVDYSTGPVLFGEIGISGQHAFFQLLHQGTKLVPADILAPVSNIKCIARHHRALMSNVFAQAEALMKGRTEEEAYAELVAAGMDEGEIKALLPNKIFTGNRPTSTFLFNSLSPATLGSLIALYEHKIFVQGIIWNINSFDQWGVELGKKLASGILQELDDNEPTLSHDSSTNGLINYYKELRLKNKGESA
ncbi:MAG: glucose-6-phosphate isomerase [Gammaproteobacteria bacterium]|nr:glucose-6-phosphate isomerase [Gammaproteobacteria bacterium]NNJ50600.1 glucose-6-phosphate isomerase [Gammaproteobacteria bacterium]